MNWVVLSAWYVISIGKKKEKTTTRQVYRGPFVFVIQSKFKTKLLLNNVKFTHSIIVTLWIHCCINPIVDNICITFIWIFSRICDCYGWAAKRSSSTNHLFDNKCLRHWFVHRNRHWSSGYSDIVVKIFGSLHIQSECSVYRDIYLSWINIAEKDSNNDMFLRHMNVFHMSDWTLLLSKKHDFFLLLNDTVTSTELK